MRILLGSLVVALACSSDDTDAPSFEPGEFMRFVETEDSAKLDTAIVSYQDAEGRRVDLIAVVHVADRSYYHLLNQMFAMYDAVLFEMVMPNDADPAQIQGGDSMVSLFQKSLKDLLDLSFQLEEVDYRPDNFVHADLDPISFFRLQEERGESLFSLMLQAMLQEWGRAAENPEDSAQSSMAMMLALMSKERAFHLKYVMGEQFGDLERIAAGFESGIDGQESVLVGERNKKAMQVLDERFEDGDRYVSIFYGAAHMPDFERRLIENLGFARENTHWLTAWDIQRSGSQ